MVISRQGNGRQRMSHLQLFLLIRKIQLIHLSLNQTRIVEENLEITDELRCIIPWQITDELRLRIVSAFPRLVSCSLMRLNILRMHGSLFVKDPWFGSGYITAVG